MTVFFQFDSSFYGSSNILGIKRRRNKASQKWKLVYNAFEIFQKQLSVEILNWLGGWKSLLRALLTSCLAFQVSSLLQKCPRPCTLKHSLLGFTKLSFSCVADRWCADTKLRLSVQLCSLFLSDEGEKQSHPWDMLIVMPAMQEDFPSAAYRKACQTCVSDSFHRSLFQSENTFKITMTMPVRTNFDSSAVKRVGGSTQVCGLWKEI